MKKYVFALVFFIMLTVTAQADAVHPGLAFENARADRLITLRNWKLMEEFNLSGERARRVFGILKDFDRKRVDLIRQRRRILKDIRAELSSASCSKPKLKRLIRDYNKANVDLAKLPAQESMALNPVFTLKERARYILFSERFARQLIGAFYREKR